MVPVTGGANRKWGFTGKVETRSYERLVDALIAKRDGDFYFVDDEYNPFVRHAPVKTMGSSTTRKTVIRRSTVTWIR